MQACWNKRACWNTKESIRFRSITCVFICSSILIPREETSGSPQAAMLKPHGFNMALNQILNKPAQGWGLLQPDCTLCCSLGYEYNETWEPICFYIYVRNELICSSQDQTARVCCSVERSVLLKKTTKLLACLFFFFTTRLEHTCAPVAWVETALQELVGVYWRRRRE